MTNFQIFVGVMLTAFGMVGLIWLACLPPPKRVETEEESDTFHRRFEQ